MSQQTNWSELGYRDSHGRIKQKRGRAKEQTCLKCNGPARQWALLKKKAADKGTLREGEIQISGRPKTYHVKWSIDPWDYAPMCITCHRHMDGHRIREEKAA